jgi:hypothetical protein
VIAAILSGCTGQAAFEDPVPGNPDAFCLTQVAGDELDDYEVYSTTNCFSAEGRDLRDRGTRTSIRLIRPKGSESFSIEVVSVLSTHTEEAFAEVRFMAGRQRISMQPTLFHRFSDRTHAYVLRVPWATFKALEGNVRMRFYGKFTRDAMLDDRHIRAIKALVNFRRWKEQSDIPSPDVPAPPLPRDTKSLA